MSVPPPTLQELERRLKEHLSIKQGNEKVVMIWRGYLAGLLEFGTINIDVYDKVTDLLPELGFQELEELLGGLPGDGLKPDEPDRSARAERTSTREGL